MNLVDRIKNGMLFYEHGHVDPIDVQQERELQEERDRCKEVMFTYNNTHPREGERRQEIMRLAVGKTQTFITAVDGDLPPLSCRRWRVEAGRVSREN